MQQGVTIYGMSNGCFFITMNDEQFYFFMEHGKAVVSVDENGMPAIHPNGAAFSKNPTQEQLDFMAVAAGSLHGSSVNWAYGNAPSFRRMLEIATPDGKWVTTPEIVAERLEQTKKAQRELRERLDKQDAERSW